MLSQSAVSDSLRPRGLWPARLLCPQDSQARTLGRVATSSSRGSSSPREWPGSPALQADSSLSKPPGRQNCLKSLWGKVLPLPHASLRTAKWEILAVNYRLTITSVYCPRCPGFPPCIHARETGAAHIIRHLEPESLKDFCFIYCQAPNFYPFFFFVQQIRLI